MSGRITTGIETRTNLHIDELLPTKQNVATELLEVHVEQRGRATTFGNGKQADSIIRAVDRSKWAYAWAIKDDARLLQSRQPPAG